MTKETMIMWIYRLLFLLLLFLCLFLLMKLYPIYHPILRAFKAVFVPFVIASLITYLLHPVVEWLHKSGIPRFVAILIIYTLFFGGIGYSVYKGLPFFIVQLKQLMRNIPEMTQVYKSWLYQVDHHTSKFPPALHAKIEHYITVMEIQAGNTVAKAIFTLKKMVDYLFVFIVTPFLVFYFLNDFEKIKRACWYMTPMKWRKGGNGLLKEIDKSLGGYIRGQLLVGALLGVAASVALWIAGMPYPLLLGFLIAITDVIPFFGPILGALPVLFIAITVSWNLFWIVSGIMILLQFVEGNILGPFIVGKSLNIHPVFIIFALLLGGEIAGVLGLVFAVPVFAVIKVIVLHIRNYRLQSSIDKGS